MIDKTWEEWKPNEDKQSEEPKTFRARYSEIMDELKEISLNKKPIPFSEPLYQALSKAWAHQYMALKSKSHSNEERKHAIEQFIDIVKIANIISYSQNNETLASLDLSILTNTTDLITKNIISLNRIVDAFKEIVNSPKTNWRNPNLVNPASRPVLNDIIKKYAERNLAREQELANIPHRPDIPPRRSPQAERALREAGLGTALAHMEQAEQKRADEAAEKAAADAKARRLADEAARLESERQAQMARDREAGEQKLMENEERERTAAATKAEAAQREQEEKEKQDRITAEKQRAAEEEKQAEAKRAADEAEAKKAADEAAANAAHLEALNRLQREKEIAERERKDALDEAQNARAAASISESSKTLAELARDSERAEAKRAERARRDAESAQHEAERKYSDALDMLADRDNEKRRDELAKEAAYRKAVEDEMKQTALNDAQALNDKMDDAATDVRKKVDQLKTLLTTMEDSTDPNKRNYKREMLELVADCSKNLKELDRNKKDPDTSKKIHHLGKLILNQKELQKFLDQFDPENIKLPPSWQAVTPLTIFSQSAKANELYTDLERIRSIFLRTHFLIAEASKGDENAKKEITEAKTLMSKMALLMKEKKEIANNLHKESKDNRSPNATLLYQLLAATKHLLPNNFSLSANELAQELNEWYEAMEANFQNLHTRLEKIEKDPKHTTEQRVFTKNASYATKEEFEQWQRSIDPYASHSQNRITANSTPDNPLKPHFTQGTKTEYTIYPPLDQASPAPGKMSFYTISTPTSYEIAIKELAPEIADRNLLANFITNHYADKYFQKSDQGDIKLDDIQLKQLIRIHLPEILTQQNVTDFLESKLHIKNWQPNSSIAKDFMKEMESKKYKTVKAKVGKTEKTVKIPSQKMFEHAIEFYQTAHAAKKQNLLINPEDKDLYLAVALLNKGLSAHNEYKNIFGDLNPGSGTDKNVFDYQFASAEVQHYVVQLVTQLNSAKNAVAFAKEYLGKEEHKEMLEVNVSPDSPAGLSQGPRI